VSAEISAVQAAAMSEENNRRRLAAQRPGHGAPVPLSESPAGAATGKPTEAGLMAGMGYSEPPGPSAAQVTYYVVPNYAADAVGGYDFTAGRQEAPVRRHVTDLGDGRIFIEGASTPAGKGFTVVSSPGRPSLLGRLAGWLRGRSR
jgi:hypothetical protein